MKKLLVSLAFLCTISQASWAQTDTSKSRSRVGVRPSSIGVSFFLNDYTTAQRIRSTSLSAVLRDKAWTNLSAQSPGLAVTYFKGIRRHIDFAGTLGASFARNVIPNSSTSNESLLLEADASFNFKMLPDNYFISPYLIAGIGGSKYRDYYGAFIPLGGGINFNFIQEATLFTTFQYRIPITTETNNYHFLASVGIAGILGKREVPPPPPPPPPPPADTDGDGILDNLDQCPTVPGVPKYNGCPIPDTDKDNINDEEDKCPTVPGTAKYNGCPIPDTDGDTINDEEDRCPTVAGVARYQGCPVPDTDGDGINDEEDRCPTVPGIRENNGCPEIKQEVINRINYAARNIFFITGSAKLSPKSNKALDEVASILKSDPALKLSIDGHTDNVGKADYNMNLSQNRANSVRAYLVTKGIEESRLTATGYGLEKPVADNKTAAGRAKNRRVEMKLEY